MSNTRVPAWKSQLQPASFRGVKFFVGDAETVIGRRNVLHEYPLRDTPYAEDLGKKAREFTINAYVIGDDVFNQSKQLIAAIENNDTPGTLVHPSLGLKTVIPTQCRHIFKNNEGGIEYFVLTFVEAGINQYPTTVIDTQSNSQKAANVSIQAMQDSFASLFTTNGFSDALSSRAQASLIGTPAGTGGNIIPAANSFTGVISSVLNRGSFLSGQTQNYSALKGQLSSFTNNITSTIADSSDLGSAISSIVAGLAASFPDKPTQQINALTFVLNNYGVGITPIPLTTVATPNRIQESVNQQQLIDLVQILALIQMVISVSQMDFASRQDALAMMNTLELMIEPKLLELGNLGQDEAFNALNNARIAMVLDIKTRSATLKNIVYIKNNYPIPALVLAYKQYQDATQEADIVSRNHIVNPVFVPSNKNIEILV